MLNPKKQVTSHLKELQAQLGMVLVREIAPSCRCTTHSGLQQMVEHHLIIVRRIERVAVDIEIETPFGMLQSTATSIATRMLILCIIRDTRLLVNRCGTVLRVIIHTDNLYRVLTLYLADSPKTGLQVRLFIIGNNHNTCQWLRTLQAGQPLTSPVNHLLRHLAKRAPIDSHVFVVPVCHNRNIFCKGSKINQENQKQFIK